MKFFRRFRQNAWMIEIGLFTFIYGFVVEVRNIYSIFDISEPFLLSNTGEWLMIAGLISTILGIFKNKLTFKIYISSLSLITFAALTRVIAILSGYTDSEPLLIVLIWLQLLILQSRLLIQSRFSMKNITPYEARGKVTENLTPFFPRANTKRVVGKK